MNAHELKAHGEASGVDWAKALKRARLTFREKMVLETRLNGYTREECGRIFKVTASRILSLESKGLKKIESAIESLEVKP